MTIRIGELANTTMMTGRQIPPFPIGNGMAGIKLKNSVIDAIWMLFQHYPNLYRARLF
jgi:hypothetical protein